MPTLSISCPGQGKNGAYPNRDTPYLPFRDLPALDKAIATACFCGLPAFISVSMLSEITFLLEPDLRGIET
jgi:hypothetical protein